MVAYKYRADSQLEFALDIIVNKRLYCSSIAAFNDPLEQTFRAAFWESEERSNKGIREVRREQEQLRVCSLSSNAGSVPLWAYYASGFSGMAIEVELPDSPEVARVRYVDFRSIGMLHIDNPKQGAFETLTQKLNEWAHEAEVRVIADVATLNSGCYYPLPQPVKRIIIGMRLNHAVLEALKLMADNHGFTIDLAKFENDVLKVGHFYGPR